MAVPVTSSRFRVLSRYAQIDFLLDDAEEGMVNCSGGAIQDVQTKNVFSALRHLNCFLEKLDAGAKADDTLLSVAMMNCITFTHPPAVEDLKEALTSVEKRMTKGPTKDLRRLAGIGQKPPDDQVLKEVPRSRWILLPESASRVWWDVLCLLVVLIDSIIVPFEIAYSTETGNSVDVWYILGVIIFGIDMCANFFTGFIAGPLEHDHGQLVTNHRRIFKYYTRTWFLIDLVSTIPWQVIAQADSASMSNESGGTKLTKITKISKIVRFLRLARMLRLFKLQLLWNRLEQSIGPLHLVEITKQCKVFCSLMYICHWNACVWWMLGNVNSIFYSNVDPYPETWTTLKSTKEFVGLSGTGSWTVFNNWIDVNKWDRYIFCFYWTTGIMRTMPVEVYPVSRVERLYTLSFMFFGLTVFSICISHIVTSWYRISKLRSEFDDNFASVRSYMHNNDVEPVLMERIRGYFQHRFASRSIFAGEKQLLEVLSPQLSSELNYALYGKQIRLMWMFTDVTSKELLHAVAGILKQCDSAPGDQLTRKNEFSTHCGILVYGLLSYSEPAMHDILMAKSNHARQQKKERIRSFSIDILLFTTPSVCLTSVWAEQCCKLLLIYLDDFNTLRTENPKIDQHIKHIAQTPRGKQVQKSRYKQMSQLDESKIKKARANFESSCRRHVDTFGSKNMR